jgi:hypothetical protein
MFFSREPIALTKVIDVCTVCRELRHRASVPAAAVDDGRAAIHICRQRSLLQLPLIGELILSA